MAETVKHIDDGGLAFPGVRNQQVGNVSDYGFTDDDSPTFADVQHPGMSLRDWFAGQALVGQLSNSEQVHAGVEPTMSILSGDRRESYAAFLAKEAYVIADAMIAARKGGAE
jgi:hypothetical protein